MPGHLLDGSLRQAGPLSLRDSPVFCPLLDPAPSCLRLDFRLLWFLGTFFMMVHVAFLFLLPPEWSHLLGFTFRAVGLFASSLRDLAFRPSRWTSPPHACHDVTFHTLLYVPSFRFPPWQRTPWLHLNCNHSQCIHFFWCVPPYSFSLSFLV